MFYVQFSHRIGFFLLLHFSFFFELIALIKKDLACFASFLAVFSEPRIPWIGTGPFELLAMLRIALNISASAGVVVICLISIITSRINTIATAIASLQATFLCFGEVLHTAFGPVICAVLVVHVTITILSSRILSSKIVTHSQVMSHFMSNGLKNRKQVSSCISIKTCMV